MRAADHIPLDPEREEWDVLVIGTGMGGSTAGYELARLGRRVLFLEKGKFLDRGPQPAPTEVRSNEEVRLLTGRWPLPIKGWTSFGDVEFFGPLGCGTGGSTTLYSAQMERFSAVDFHPRSNFPNVRDANLPEEWPLSYEELLPFYRRAEAHFSLCGTPDPLNPDGEGTLREPPPLSERDQVLFDSFTRSGLHPYRSHVGYHAIDNCFECFDLCLKNCKSDAASKCLFPALTTFGARILPECEVQELIADRTRVRAVRARWNGRDILLTAKVVILGLGAFMTPVLLLNSASPDWPDGLANSSGAVGRNLMLHTSDFLVVDQSEERSVLGPRKSLTLNDFYYDRGRKLGTLQSVGMPLLAEFILKYLRYVEEKDPRWWRRRISDHLPRLSEIAARRFRRASLFSTIVEDLPYPENRVLPDPHAPDGRRFQYTYSRDLHERNRHFRKQLVRRLASRHKIRFVNAGKNNINYGHVCGTCRFGDKPGTSVLDKNNRAHDLDNLYVVDASFFPSSGGTNPSLTIAANALRVGAIIHEQLQ
ncbi:MAG: glucose-methanol-choline oxidoreductase [Acidobacteria bacterium]|nr:MAG: glucose-methanol-choline oxidoreductase [Acidobacteriota bacterium]